MRIHILGHAAVVVETDTTRVLFDPWLTERLDRFWVRAPSLPTETRERAVADLDGILLSHHHYDHHHYPSLGLLDRKVPVLYPAGQSLPRFTGSGLGHQAIPWTLRRLGFDGVHPVQVPQRWRLGDLTISTLPSRVTFPEATYLVESDDATVLLCGDSLLHENTRRFFSSEVAPHIDVAFVPMATHAPPSPLIRRQPIADPATFERLARETFDVYVDVVDADVTVPSSFGWKVSATGAHDFSWLNRLMFVLTPWQAYERLRRRGRPALLPGPGDQMVIRRHELKEATGPYVERPGLLEQTWEPLTFDPATDVPAFDPELDQYEGPEQRPTELVASLLEHLVGTDYWFRQLETAARIVVRVHSNHGREDVAMDFRAGGEVVPLGTADGARDGVVLTVAASTLRALLDGDLLYESSYGLWTATDNLLSAVLHQPTFYVRHVDKQLRFGPATALGAPWSGEK